MTVPWVRLAWHPESAFKATGGVRGVRTEHKIWARNLIYVVWNAKIVGSQECANLASRKRSVKNGERVLDGLLRALQKICGEVPKSAPRTESSYCSWEYWA